MTPNSPQPMMLPCPFCGGQGVYCFHVDDPTRTRHWILCRDCHACPGDRLSEAEAIAAWNTRLSPTPTADEDDPLLARAYIAPPLCGDDLVMRLMYELHAHVPEEQRPCSMSDLSDEQAARARKAVRAVLREWEAAKSGLDPKPATADDVERVARAIVISRGGNPDECVHGYSWQAGEMGKATSGMVCHRRRWEDFISEARAAIGAVSPIIATDAMVNDVIAAVMANVSIGRRNADDVPAAKIDVTGAQEAIRAALAMPPADEAIVGRLREALHDIAAERQRQIESEGWTPEHDDSHSDGSLADAAAAYALNGSGHYANAVDIWPWDRSWWKPKTFREDLVRAGALIVAEIERLDRATLASLPDTSATEKGE